MPRIACKNTEWIFEQKFVILSAQGVVTCVKPRERGFMPWNTARRNEWIFEQKSLADDRQT